MLYTIKYQAGTYSRLRSVHADDEQEAIAKVKGSIRREMTLPMYSQSYRIVDTSEEEKYSTRED